MTVKAYTFNQEKLRRIAKKYGYKLVTKLPTLPSSKDVKTPNSTLTNHEKHVEKRMDTFQQLGNISNSVTKPTVQEAIEYALSQMAKRLPDNTTGDMFLHDLKSKGLSKEEAEELLNKLTDEGSLAYDNEGWLVKT